MTLCLKPPIGGQFLKLGRSIETPQWLAFNPQGSWVQVTKQDTPCHMSNYINNILGGSNNEGKYQQGLPAYWTVLLGCQNQNGAANCCTLNFLGLNQ